MNNYILLFEDFYDDFKNKNGLARIIKKYLKTFTIIIGTYILLYILISFFIKEQSFNFLLKSILGILFLLSITIVFINVIFISNKEKRILKEKRKICLLFDKLLKQEKYKNIDNITMLSELEKYYQYKLESYISENNSSVNIHTFSKMILNVVVPIFVSEFLQLLPKSSNQIHLNDMLILSISGIIILICSIIMTIIWIIREFNLKNDEPYINMLIILIKERKINIFESRNDNLFNKLKYSLRLGIFS